MVGPTCRSLICAMVKPSNAAGSRSIAMSTRRTCGPRTAASMPTPRATSEPHQTVATPTPSHRRLQRTAGQRARRQQGVAQQAEQEHVCEPAHAQVTRRVQQVVGATVVLPPEDPVDDGHQPDECERQREREAGHARLGQPPRHVDVAAAKDRGERQHEGTEDALHGARARRFATMLPKPPAISAVTSSSTGVRASPPGEARYSGVHVGPNFAL